MRKPIDQIRADIFLKECAFSDSVDRAFGDHKSMCRIFMKFNEQSKMVTLAAMARRGSTAYSSESTMSVAEFSKSYATAALQVTRQVLIDIKKDIA